MLPVNRVKNKPDSLTALRLQCLRFCRDVHARLFCVLGLLALALLAWSGGAAAWSSDAHRIAARIAQEEIKPETEAAIEELLGGGYLHTYSLSDLSTWADKVHNNRGWEYTKKWHYVNFDYGKCRYSPKKHCRNGDCIIEALNQQIDILGDKKQPKKKRVQALKFVVHLVSDIHQPLHAAWKKDRGGNQVSVRFRHEDSNLHRFWDYWMVEAVEPNWKEHFEDLEGRTLTMPEKRVAYLDGDDDDEPADWALESCRIAVSDGFYPKGDRIDEAYVRRWGDVADERLVLSGLRLARVLDAALADASKQTGSKPSKQKEGWFRRMKKRLGW